MFTTMQENISFQDISNMPDFTKNNGLISAIVQDYLTKEVLMSAFMNKEAWEETLKTGKACYYSRSRQSLWRKGESSGHVQHIKEIRIDCDNDCLVLIVQQIGAACHTNHISCFYRQIVQDENSFNIIKCSSILAE